MCGLECQNGFVYMCEGDYMPCDKCRCFKCECFWKDCVCLHCKECSQSIKSIQFGHCCFNCNAEKKTGKCSTCQKACNPKWKTCFACK